MQCIGLASAIPPFILSVLSLRVGMSKNVGDISNRMQKSQLWTVLELNHYFDKLENNFERVLQVSLL